MVKVVRTTLMALSGSLMACGGGGDGGSVTPPPPPPNNTPARVTLSVTSPLSLVSGATSTVTASVFTSDGRQLSGQSITWATSDQAIARVSDGTITAALVGTANITAAVGSVVSSPLAVTVTPGTPTQLVVRTQPAGARVAVPFTTQPVVDIRDAAGNVVSSSTLSVSVALASGGGTLSGTSTVTAASGTATFAGLTLSGTIGARTLTFTAPGVTAVTSASFTLAAGDPSSAAIVQQPIGGAIGAPMVVPPVIELRDVAGNVATGATTPVVASVVGGTATIAAGGSAAPVNGRATFTALSLTGGIGSYTLSFVTTGVAAVAAQPISLSTIVYGTTAQKIVILNSGGAFTPVVSAALPPQFRSSAPSRVSVDAQGRMQGMAEGQSWVSAAIPAGSDSVLVIVPRTADGPIVGASLPGFTLRGGSTDIDLVLLPRGTAVGSFSVFVTVNSQDFTPQFNPFTVTNPGVQVTAVQMEGGPMRFSVVATTPITQPLSFGRVTLLNGPPGAQLMLRVTALDANAPDGTDIFPLLTSTYFPVIFR